MGRYVLQTLGLEREIIRLQSKTEIQRWEWSHNPYTTRFDTQKEFGDGLTKQQKGCVHKANWSKKELEKEKKMGIW